ncbi:sensor histidine kinase [Salinarimonas soli]|uniref:histidine kinase n=1 Tax=Salinarimonas soli TaxID=1638099 RepID=A0A5B2VIC5_9HYPH|nr:HAMP domain-containing sensor histidine kinase [Salinarimonas soli]KAA2238306.1 HAMP domain-containing histidine kinase [Salinarimonas soli]
MDGVGREGEGSVGFGLSARLLVLTVAFVMLAEILIYVPSVANFRAGWLRDRLAAAQVAALVLDAAPDSRLPEGLEMRLLEGVGARAVAVRGGGTRRLLSLDPMPPEVGRVVDLRGAGSLVLIRDAFATLLAPAGQPIRVVGEGVDGADFVEIVLEEEPLRAAMLRFSVNILILSLVISGITAGLVFLALHRVIVRPVRRLAGNVAAFAENPEDGGRIIDPSGRRDEIGLAERALERMETALAGELRQKRRLADLGLAVSKVNHDLRNMLTTAQLLTDRLGTLTDPLVQRTAPRLVATLQRAIDFCEATLAYGRAGEPLPRRGPVRLAEIAEELPDLVDLAPGAGITLRLDIPADLTIDVDSGQLSRVLVNLVRNAVQALAQGGAQGGPPMILVSARRADGAVTIRVADNGPGLANRSRAHLFEAFQGAARPGGTGLGLAICAEIVRAHGGTISLDDTGPGAHFRVVIPDRTTGAANLEKGVAKRASTL